MKDLPPNKKDNMLLIEFKNLFRYKMWEWRAI